MASSEEQSSAGSFHTDRHYPVSKNLSFHKKSFLTYFPSLYDKDDIVEGQGRDVEGFFCFLMLQ